MSEEAKTPKLLLVDDEERFRTTLAKRLTEKGLDVSAAGSGMEALEEIKKDPFDVIVLDIKMPGMDGIETLSEIKKTRPLVEVILLTGHGTIDTAIEGMRLGAYDYLMKPCEIEQLMEKIDGAHQVKLARDKRLIEAERRSQMDRLQKAVRF